MRYFTRLLCVTGLLLSGLFSPAFADIQGIAFLFPATSPSLPASYYPVYIEGNTAAQQAVTDVSHSTSPLPYVAPQAFMSFSGSSETIWLSQSRVTKGPAYFCGFTVNADGSVVNNTCNGVVKDVAKSTSSVTVMDMPANIFITSNGVHPFPFPSVINSNRTLTFVNHTSYDLCLNSNSNYADPSSSNCSAPGDYILSQGGNPLNYSIPASGKNSGAFVIVGFRAPGTNDWTPAGQALMNNANRDFATKMEGTFYPQTNGVTTGVSDVDVSLVDGYNFAVNYYPTNGGICSSGQNGFVFYSQSNPMSQVPKAGVNLEGLCPANQDAVSNGAIVGCFSACTYNTATYGANSPQAEQACCSGPYNTSGTCSPVQSQFAYVTNIHNNTINGYAYAYDDNIANFSCDQNLSFTYVISDLSNDA